MLIDIRTLKQFTKELLLAQKVPDETATFVTASLIEADTCGYTTHGLALLPLYSDMLEHGAIDPNAVPVVDILSGCLSSVDGRRSFGQLTGQLATNTGIEQAASQGIAVVAIQEGGHLGRLGEWAEMACRRDLVFLAFTNTGGGARNVAAAGAHTAALSTNPVAFGIPVCGGLAHDITVDMATSQVSGSTIRQYHNQGRTIDPEWTITTKGETTLDPAHFMEGAAVLLPLGGRSTGHKGFGLALVAELLGGIAGGSMAGESDDEWFSNAAMFFFLDPHRFLPREQWMNRVTEFAAYIHEKGARLPGSGAHERMLESLQVGIKVSGQTAGSLCKLAEHLGVTVPEPLRAAGGSDRDEKVRTW